MRLKNLEIKGFKSFGDKVTINFSEGVTSIVGPNGSGKSNVVDAMRWVLGEQKTKMLRSDKMENIIFNGTKNRKPSNLAEVSMTFENTRNVLPTEFSDVTITRKLYRSGESDYLLNGVVCRLKDITDLFLDTGIGSDSYSIIELKMIDEILNDRNDTIRLLFEEAAGISKYKIRKRQTHNKLEETEADLSRVNDILFEIEKNMKTLENQAKKAERYYRLRDQYKHISSSLALFEIEHYRTSYDDLQKQFEQLSDEKLKWQNEIAQSETEIEQIKLQNVESEQALSTAQKILNDKINQINRHENEKKVKDERLKFLLDKQQILTNQIHENRSELARITEKLNSLEEDKDTETGKVVELENLLKDVKAELRGATENQKSLKEEHDSLAGIINETQQQIHKIEKDQAIRAAQATSLQSEEQRLFAETEKITAELIIAEEKSVEIRQVHESKQTELSDLNISYEKLKSELEILEKEIKDLSELLTAENRKIDARQNEYNLTKSLVENLEGFPDSIKFLKKNNRIVSDAPLLADIITCQADYKIAIESYLEPYMNYFVLDSMVEAQQAIHLLSEASKGRAYFFVLEELDKNEKAIVENIDNCIHALQVIDTEKKYDPLFNQLLKNVYVVNNNQDNTPFIKTEKNKKLVFISQNGKYSRTKYSISGGSVGLFDGKRIGRAKNLSVLEKEIKSLEISRAKLKATHDELQMKFTDQKHHLEDKRIDIQRKQTEINQHSQILANQSARTEHLKQHLETNNKRFTNVKQQLHDLFADENNKPEKTADQLEDLRKQLNENNVTLHDLTQQLSTATDFVNHAAQKYNQQNILVLQQQNKINTIVRDTGFYNSQKENITRALDNYSIESEKASNELNNIMEVAKDTDEEVVKFYEEKVLLEKEVEQREVAYYKVRGEIDSLEHKVKELRKKKDYTDVLKNAVQEKITELKIQLNSLKERLSVEFNINLEELLEQKPDPELSQVELREKVEKMKNQLNNYGPINPMAIEAYNEIKERYDFIIAQKLDLVSAKESLLNTINEIDATAKEKFTEAFNSIREHFIIVFRSLFSEEDKCDLILVDPNDPLESNINIIAQPKGKRPLTINQLSGGEKTLTATALLFGIYLLKPAPFCIFDEVDAPLDDNNIDKFNRIIKKFSDQSQFIIVTHNKRTMASTDIMYGITMVEQGVTQVVPVDMREFNEVAVN
jgi:chromosome segregation protein